MAPALGWGFEGHRIIATIASSEFTDTTAKAIRELLGETSVADASVWADEVRSDPKWDWIKPLHYINVPRDATRIDMGRDGADGQQIVSTILTYREVLADPTKSSEERLLALRLVLHMVGDVHQPLHVSYRDDLGGNKLTLKAFGRNSNLHRAWDTDLIQRRLKDTKGGWPVMSADLRQAIKPAQRTQWLREREPIAWANESLAITRRIYSRLPKAPSDIDDAYFREWMPVVNERLQAAGVRLGALLNDALDPASRTPAQGREKRPSRPSGSGKDPAAPTSEEKPDSEEKSAPGGKSGPEEKAAPGERSGPEEKSAPRERSMPWSSGKATQLESLGRRRWSRS
ncbi:MAG: S1/P1 nuclease [Phycisphaeraceae bacterium]|nr:S1/P1 nuclease [Phycisphaeraceae bacterium]